MSHLFAVMLLIQTDDPLLSPEAIERDFDPPTKESFAKLRARLLRRLPTDISRVVAVFPVEHARMLMQLHDALGDELTAELRAQGVDAVSPYVRPPSDYVPPTTE